MAEHQHLRTKNGGWRGDKQQTKLGICHLGKVRAPEVEFAISELNVESFLSDVVGSRVVESSMICQPSGGCVCGGPIRQRLHARKHSLGEERDAKERIVSPNQQSPVL